MEKLYIQLLGKFAANFEGQPVVGLDGLKVQELLSYLLINRNQPHHRERLATLLWGECETVANAKQYLRKAIWKLQAALDKTCFCRALDVDHNWIEIRATPDYWLDIAALEEQFAVVKTMRGHQLSARQVESLEAVIGACHGDLLEGRYYDWCIYERERYKLMELLILDRLTEYFESIDDFDTACLYALRILQQDPARERTHRQLIRLRYKAGDRTGALRQYHHCEETLLAELGVVPGPKTVALYRQICSVHPAPANGAAPVAARMTSLADDLTRLNTLLLETQRQVSENIEQIKLLQQD